MFVKINIISTMKDTTLFSMKQVMPNVATTHDYHSMKIVLFQDEKWTDLDTQSSAILEVSLPQVILNDIFFKLLYYIHILFVFSFLVFNP
jgi:hypothetical protein